MADSVYLGSVWASFDLRAENFRRSAKNVDDDLDKLDRNLRLVKHSSVDTTKTINDSNFSHARRELNETHNALARFRGQLSHSANAIRSFQIAFQGFRTTAMLGAILILGGALVQLVGALVAAGQAALVLPAGLAAVGAAAGVAKIGLMGMDEAFKALSDGDAEKLAEAMQKLSPAAQEFVRAAGRFKEAFDPIRRSIQESLFANLGAQVDNFTKTLPNFSGSLNLVAVALNGMVIKAGEAAASPLFAGLVATSMQTSAAVINNFAGAIAPLIGIMDALVKAGAPYIVQLSEFIAGGLKSGEAFLSSERGMQAMQGAINRGITAIKQINRLVGALTRALLNLFDAGNASGSNLLTVLTDMVNRFNAFAESAEGHKTLSEFFALMNTVFYDSLVIIGKLLNGIVELFAFIDRLPGPIRNVVAGFLAMVTVLTPVMIYLTTVAGAIVSLSPLLPVLGNGLQFLARAFVFLGKAAVTALLTIGRAALALLANPVFLAIAAVILVIAGLAYLIINNWSTVSTFFVNLWNSIMAALTPVVAFIVTAWNTIFSVVDTVMHAIWVTIQAVWNVIWTVIQYTLGVIIALIAIQFNAMYGVISTVMGFIWNVISTVWNTIYGIVSSILGAIWGVITTTWNAVYGFLAGILSAIAGFVSAMWNAIYAYISNAVQNIWNRIVSVFNAVYGFAAGIWNSIYGVVAGAVGNLVNVVGGLSGRILDAVKGFGSLLVNAGRDLIQGLINGITGMGGRLASSIKNFVTENVPGPVKKLLGIHSPSTLFAKFGTYTMQGYIKGIDSMSTSVQRSVSGVFDNLQPLTSDVSGSVAILPSFSSSSVKSAHGGTPVSTTFNGDVNIGSEVDADSFLARLTRNQELAAKGLTTK